MLDVIVRVQVEVEAGYTTVVSCTAARMTQLSWQAFCLPNRGFSWRLGK